MIAWMMHNGWWVGAASLLLAVAGGLVVVGLVVMLPADHFRREKPRLACGDERRSFARWALVVLKNIVGILALAAGLVMALPFVPGPGLLLIVIGVSLLNFPGKYAAERFLMGRPGVLGLANRIRAVCKREPLLKPG